VLDSIKPIPSIREGVFGKYFEVNFLFNPRISKNISFYSVKEIILFCKKLKNLNLFYLNYKKEFSL
jgi:hypothetical protein